jgi:ribonuclease P protein component
MGSDTEQAADKLHRPGACRGRIWNRLPKRADFLRISAAGTRRVTPGFILQYALNGDEAAPRLRVGFTASRKVGNAVARNRAKRRLRALADRIMPELASPAHDYVFIGRTETLRRDFAAMERDLRHALKKAAEQKNTSHKPAPGAGQE